MYQEHLEHQIDLALRVLESGLIRQIILGPGSDVTDLSRAVDVEVATPEGREVLVTIMSNSFVDQIVSREHDPSHPNPEFAQIITTGGPLVIVRKITGDSVVKGVVRYLELEAAKS